MTPHATAMLHQPRVPSTGERQATELNIKWQETLAQKKAMLAILSQTTGHDVGKLDKVNTQQLCDQGTLRLSQDMQRPLYMTANDAIRYGIVDKIVERDAESKTIADVMNASEWDNAAGLVQKSL